MGHRMRFFDALKSLNPLRTPAARTVEALRSGLTLGEVMRDAADPIAKKAVASALEEFDDGPAALLITCLLESATLEWERLGAEVLRAQGLTKDGAAWACTRLTEYGRSLADETMSQHVINLVLGVTGLHVEALILTRADVDAPRLEAKLAELLKQGLSSCVSRADLARSVRSIPSGRRPRFTGTVPAPRPSAS